MTIKILFFFLVLFFSLNTLFANEVDSVLLSGVKNIYKVDEGVYRSGQPTKEQFLLLDRYGIDEILNLRFLGSDKKKANQTSLKLHHNKIITEVINEHKLLEALRIIKDRQGNILIHCRHGSDRTGAVVAMYRIVFQGWTKEKAINELKNGGYGYHSIYVNIPGLINKVDIESFKKKLFEESDE